MPGFFKKLSAAAKSGEEELPGLTEDEWALLEDLPLSVGMAVSLGDSGGGKIADRRELDALLSAIHDVSKNFYGNMLIHHVFNRHGRLKDLNVRSVRNEDFDDGFGRQRYSDAALEKVLEKCRGATDILSRKASRRDAEEYRRYLLLIGARVAAASGSGILGTGPRVSGEERRILDIIADALQVPGLML